MDISERNLALVERINAGRIAAGLSYQRIADRMAANGHYVSPSTVRRVLTGEVPSSSIRYEEVLQPMAVAVLGSDYDTPPTQSDDRKAIIDYYEAELEHWHSFYQKRLDEVCATKQAAIEQLNIAQMDFHKKDKQIVGLFAVICVLLALLVTLLAIDVIDPNWGILFK